MLFLPKVGKYPYTYRIASEYNNFAEGRKPDTMNGFIEYLSASRALWKDGQFDVEKQHRDFRIYQNDQPLLTAGGREFRFENERLCTMIATDLMTAGKAGTDGLTSPALFAFQVDFVEGGRDPFPAEWNQLLGSDPFVLMKTEGRSGARSHSPEDPLFSLSFLTLATTMRQVNEFVEKTLGEYILEESEDLPFNDLLKMVYSQMTGAQKTVVQAFSALHSSGIVLPMMLVDGRIGVSEYAKAMVALRMAEVTGLETILPGIVRAMDYLEVVNAGDEGQEPDQVVSVIRTGENETTEFKSTLRWDIRAGKTNQAIEHAALKTIAAFLNSEGGNLLIGVRDDGSIEGIETDKFVNEDKFLLHLWTLIRSCMGRDVSPYVRTVLEKQGDKTVCLVRCRPCNRPVFLRQAGFNEEFFIRVGPSSNALDISEALKYITDRFGKLVF